MPARFSAGSFGHQAAPRRSGWKLLRPVVAAVALGFLMADDGISRDEFLCEAAVAHLEDCCPEFSTKLLYCVRSGCDGNVIPDLSEDRAQCLRAKSCDELQVQGACDFDRWEPVASCVAPCSPKVPACS